MNEKDRELVLELRNKIPTEIDKHIERVVVFGSRVRGESVEDSDLDVLLLVDVKTPEIEQRLEDIAYELMWDHDFRPIISLKVVEFSKYHDAVRRGFSFYNHIGQEGITV